MNLSPTDLCNLSLSLIGAAEIANLDDSADRSPEARACRVFYPIIQETVLSSHPWNCASQPATLTETTTAPDFGYSYALPLPPDYIRFNGFPGNAGQRYRIYRRVLHCNVCPAEIDYVYRETDLTRYSPMLIRCFYLNLAFELGLALTHDVRIAREIFDYLQRFFLPIARMHDATEDGPRVWESGVLTDTFRHGTRIVDLGHLGS